MAVSQGWLVGVASCLELVVGAVLGIYYPDNYHT